MTGFYRLWALIMNASCKDSLDWGVCWICNLSIISQVEKRGSSNVIP